MSTEEVTLRGGHAQHQDPYLRSLEQLHQLGRYRGEPAQFWRSFLGILMSMADASAGAVLVRGAGKGAPWRVAAREPPQADGLPDRLTGGMDTVAEPCVRDGVTLWGADGERRAAVHLDTGGGEELCLAALVLGRSSRLAGPEVTRRLLLAAHAPADYQARRVAVASAGQVESLAGALDLSVVLNDQNRFLPAAMAFCNEIAARLRCERVSLGWTEKGYIELQAASHVDRFDRKTDAVQLLEGAMEEALDQDADVLVPADGSGGAVSRDHQSFARAQDSRYLCSLPLRVEGAPVAVCTCERNTTPFTESELQRLRLLCDLAARRLADLKRWDRWFGARLAMGAKEGIGRLIGFEHTWLKVLGIILAAAVAVLLFASVKYRVTAPVELRTDDVAVLSAPYDGHIDKVDVRIGDTVQEGQELLALDQTDLLLAQAQIVAQEDAYQGELAKARASYSLADMRIAQARVEQAAAQYEQIRYHLDQAIVRAPFTGVVVEGDLRQRIGLPVHQGDTLFRMARIDRLYAQLRVSERDVRELANVTGGEIALASRPQESAPIALTRVEPEAVTESTGNVFIVDCGFPEGPAGWWRPGMTGVAKLDVGTRRLLWVLTHRTADFLRLRLWW
ncbi:MAG TPA: efflux RND transporter periplasmic adaptor subunit [Spirochaetia bacterium]|nr:efflux RND transporter periplasmic adaptor subunit [Spirochaetia bacterium]